MTITALSPDILLGDDDRPTWSRRAKIEEVDRETGTILMRAAPYDHEIELMPKFFETFARGTFAKAAEAPHRVKLFHEHSNHPQSRLIGHAADIEDRGDGVWMRARFSNTLAGQEARELASDGTLDQVSVEFRPMKDWIKVEKRADGIHVRHARAHLLGVALVPHGAYADKAFVAAVRAAGLDHQEELDAAAEAAAAEAERNAEARRAAIERLNRLSA